MTLLSKRYLFIFMVSLFVLSTDSWSSDGLEDQIEVIEANDQRRRHEYGLDVLYEDWRWDINSARRGYRFYSVVQNFCSISGKTLAGVTTILSAVAASQSGPEKHQDGSGWALAATVTGTAGTVLLGFSSAAKSAASKRKKQVKELTKQEAEADGEEV